MDHHKLKASNRWPLFALAGWVWLLAAVFLAIPALAAPPPLQPFPTETQSAPAELRRQAAISSSNRLGDTLPGMSKSKPPTYIKGLYITYYGLGSEDHRSRVQELLETTELNAIVMDVKGDRGYIPYSSTVQLAVDIGANPRPMIEDWGGWMEWFQEHNIYTIARIVVFKDEPLSSARAEWAVIDANTGGVWRDRENLGWADPMREEAWNYNIALAVEAAQKGFDEIQFDYVRFPSDGTVSSATFMDENNEENRVASITDFLSKAREALAPYGVNLAIDVFGYTTWRTDDMGIGQQIEALSPYLDVLSPMLYPSTFSDGLPGLPKYRNAVAFPYEIVNKSTVKALERLKEINPELQIRPWIQDFSDYAFDRRTYTPDEIRLQMEGARQAGATGWLLWDPRVQYTDEALISAEPAYPPNEKGQILVLAYHLIGEPEDRWQRTPDNFRSDLARLLAEGYYPVNLRDLARGNLGMIPAGKRPVVLTFDESSVGQFRFLPDGRIDPDSAVGILLAFHQAHPADWPLRATFFVLQDVDAPERTLFGQPELAQQKLQMLVDWGMEVGSQTVSHPNLAESAETQIKRQLALSQAGLKELLPGYEVASLSVPFGLYPQDDSLLAGGAYEEHQYHYKAAVEVAGGLAPSPYSADFDPFHIPRIQATQTELDLWLRHTSQPGVSYVSAGERPPGR